jgi:hypothetical protein
MKTTITTNMFAEGVLPTPANGDLAPYAAGHRPGEITIQRLLQLGLDNLRAIAADPNEETFARLFGFFTTEQLANFKAWLVVNAIAVEATFPNASDRLPIVAVHCREEQEAPDDQQLLQHELIQVDATREIASELVSHFFFATLDIIVITPDPAMTLMLYRVVWYIVFANRLDLLEQADFHNLSFSGGVVSFDATAFPNWQYARIITMKYLTLFDFYLEDEHAPKLVSLSQLLTPSSVSDESTLPPWQITDFTVTPSFAEIGQTVANPTFNATYLRPAAAVSLDDAINPQLILTAPFTAANEPFNYQLSAPGAQYFTLTASEAGGEPLTATVAISWLARVFFGAATPRGTFNSAFILGLSGSTLGRDFARTIAFSAGTATQKYYYAFPTQFGSPFSFIDPTTGLVVPFNRVAAGVVVTNTFGATLVYDVWESVANAGVALTVLAN